ncbi:hypothetical protein C8R46DRAFT_1220587 [Mycena filopes]|nr:hypothetical protein C8R46DRAFT_1220587 [Mycena filopes]
MSLSLQTLLAAPLKKVIGHAKGLTDTLVVPGTPHWQRALTGQVGIFLIGTLQYKPIFQVIQELSGLCEGNDAAQAVFKEVLYPSLHTHIYKFPLSINIRPPPMGKNKLEPFQMKLPGNPKLNIPDSKLAIVDFFGGFGALASLVETQGLNNQTHPHSPDYFASVIANFAGMCCVVADMRLGTARDHPSMVQITWERETGKYSLGALAIGSTIPDPNGHWKNLCTDAHRANFFETFSDKFKATEATLARLEPMFREMQGQRLGHCAELMAWIALHLEIKRGAKFYTLALSIDDLLEDDPVTSLPFYYGIPACKTNCHGLAQALKTEYKTILEDITLEQILAQVLAALRR